MPHLMANNSASVLVTLTAWWIVFIKGLLTIWICVMEMATLFLMLASKAIKATEGDEEDSKVNLSSSWAQNLLSFLLSQTLKEKRSEKLSIILKPGENSELRGEKEEKHSWDLLAMSTKWPLTKEHCWLVSKSNTLGLKLEDKLRFESISKHKRWSWGSLYTRSWDLPPSFWRWSLMGIRPTMASTLYEGEVLKAPNIHIAAYLCILFKIFMW